MKKQTDRDRGTAAILHTLAVDPATALGTLNLYLLQNIFSVFSFIIF
jgi:hypothetical protein